jgi:hypothetical protein
MPAPDRPLGARVEGLIERFAQEVMPTLSNR